MNILDVFVCRHDCDHWHHSFFVGTENGLKILKDLNMEWILDYMPPSSPTDAALAIVKGGAQRWQRLYFPYLETKPIEMLCNIMPQTINSMNRKMFEEK